MILKRTVSENRRLYNIVEDLKDGFCTISINGIFIYYNKAATEMFGKEDINDLNFYDTFIKDKSQILKIKNHLNRNEFLKDYEIEIYDISEKKFPVILSLTKIKDPSNNLVGVTILIKDMTYLKRVQQQLLQAQKMESIGMLASGVAHEFNNILTGIIPNAELIKLTSDQSGINYMRAESIERSANRAAEIVKKLLNFARDDRKLEVKYTNFIKTARETIDILKRLFDKNIELVDEMNDDHLSVRIDATSVQQIIMNLAINAKDAINGNGKIIFKTKKISIFEDDEIYMNKNLLPGNYCKFEVKDTGCGIPPKILKNIFDPFFTTKRPGEGTGLGLSMVYGLVTSSGGTIEVHSELNEGTTFYIFLPSENIEAEKQESGLMKNKFGNGQTILVIDDEKIIVDMAADMLKSLGYNVITAINGLEGLQKYKENKNVINLVILDLLMPEMNGSTCFENLKIIDPQVNVIISSGIGDIKKKDELTKQGIRDYIEKPYSMQKIAEKIDKVINQIS